MNTYKKELKVAEELARKAGKIMLKYADGNQKVETKEDNSFVTVADKMINTLVLKELKKSFPKDGVIGEEESNTEYGLGRKWFCDPIDGTAAYVQGVPTSVFSLALVVDGRPVLGVVYDPYLDLLYKAEKGGKSFCNKRQISVSSKSLKEGIFGVSAGLKSLFHLPYIKKLIDKNIRTVLVSGAIYKCLLVAKGRLVGYVEHGLNPHDIAAVEVILECAGGKVTSLDGKILDYTKPFKGVVVSNKKIHKEVLELLKD